MVKYVNGFFSKYLFKPAFEYLLVGILISATSLLCYFFATSLNYYFVSYILLFVVTVLASILRIGPIILASTMSALIWNFFFIPPHFTFHISKTEDILVFFMFFIIALLSGILTAKIKNQEQLAKEKEERTHALFELTNNLTKSYGIQDICENSKQNIQNYFYGDFDFILQNGKGAFEINDFIVEKYNFTNSEISTIIETFESGKENSIIISDSLKKITIYPLIGSHIHLGIIITNSEEQNLPENNIFWNACVSQISNAIEREFLADLATKARLLAESDKLYKTLFNSISHEFRIPVATIISAADSLIHTEQTFLIQKQLYNEIFTASLRLDRLIGNLLNISRIENDRLSVRLDWNDCNDLVNKIRKELQTELSNFNFIVTFQNDMPLVQFDFGLMEQALYNLILNCCEHSPQHSSISINFSYTEGFLHIVIEDEGPGFPTHLLPQVFTKFFRVNNRKSGGLGLGLSIVKGFVEAHKGTAHVENKKIKGAKFKITIPSNQYEC